MKHDKYREMCFSIILTAVTFFLCSVAVIGVIGLIKEAMR